MHRRVIVYLDIFEGIRPILTIPFTVSPQYHHLDLSLFQIENGKGEFKVMRKHKVTQLEPLLSFTAIIAKLALQAYNFDHSISHVDRVFRLLAGTHLLIDF